MIWCLLRLPYRSCLLQRPNFKTYGKNYTRFKLYHLSSKHKIICNRNYFSSEALLVLYLPLVCFRLGSPTNWSWSCHRQRNGVMQLAYTRRRTILFLFYVQVTRRHSVARVSRKVSCEQAIFWGIGRRETPKKARAQRLARPGTHAIPDF